MSNAIVDLAPAVIASIGQLLDPRHLIETFGTIGVIAIVFAETGLLIGFFLPGDSLLFTAGFLASTTADSPAHLPAPLLFTGVPIAAIVGAQVGYLLGRRVGPLLFARPDSRWFKREYVERAEHYFARFGPGKAVVLARFIPIVRTFLNPVAGALGMPPRQFTTWNVVGGLLWSLGVTALGYVLGSAIPNVDRYILPGVAVIIAISVLPVAIEVLRARKAARQATQQAVR